MTEALIQRADGKWIKAEIEQDGVLRVSRIGWLRRRLWLRRERRRLKRKFEQAQPSEYRLTFLP